MEVKAVPAMTLVTRTILPTPPIGVPIAVALSHNANGSYSSFDFLKDINISQGRLCSRGNPNSYLMCAEGEIRQSTIQNFIDAYDVKYCVANFNALLQAHTMAACAR